MADIYSDIKDKLQKICQPQGLRVYFAQIVSVETDTTCTIQLEDDLKISDVRLRSVVNDEQTGILITPKTGSVVLVADLSDGKFTQMAVIMYSEIEKIEINSGKNGGLINIKDLKNNLDQLKDYVEAMNSAISASLSAIGESTAASGTAANATYKTAMAYQSIDFKDMEDDKITH